MGPSKTLKAYSKEPLNLRGKGQMSVRAASLYRTRCAKQFTALAEHLGCKPEDLNVDLVAWYEALRAIKTNHTFKTPAGTINCKLCDLNMDHEGTYKDMHAEDCEFRAVRQALSQLPERKP